MGGLPWFKCSPRDFREGMMGLTCEERGAYSTILMLIYERGEPIPDDAPWLCANLTISARAWTKVRAVLIARDKLFVIQSRGVDCLMNRRAETEIFEQSKLREKLVAGGRASKPTPKSNENNVDVKAGLEPPSSPAQAQPLKKEESEEVREEKIISPDGEKLVSAEIIRLPLADDCVIQSDPVEEAYEAYREVAREWSLPIPRKLDADRRAKLKARLADVSLDGWCDAMSRIRASPFLRGEATSFRASLDWFLKPLNLRKVLEGNYEDRNGQQQQPRSRGGLDHERRVGNMAQGALADIDAWRRREGGG